MADDAAPANDRAHPGAQPGATLRYRRPLLKAGLLLAWALVSFVCCFFARDLQFMVAGWPFNYWMAAQGAVLCFIGIVVVYAWAVNRIEQVGVPGSKGAADV